MAKTHLDRPFKGSYPISQGFGPTDWTMEGMGWLYGDGCLCYHQGSPGQPITGHLHCGVDYPMPEGTPLLAPAPAKVLLAGWSPKGFGNRVLLDHGDILTLYGHLSQFQCKVGDLLKRGQQFALSGNTGMSSGPHLHWSVMDGPLFRELSQEVYIPPQSFVYGW